MPHNDFDPTKMTQAHRVMGAVFGFAFAAIGITLIGWLWLQPFGFMHPPPIFRIFGSIIAIVFVAIGSTAGITSLKGELPGGMKDLARRLNQGGRATGQRPAGYKCPNCGAALSDEADVSPSGDVKCEYCRTWFNIHA